MYSLLLRTIMLWFSKLCSLDSVMSRETDAVEIVWHPVTVPFCSACKTEPVSLVENQ